MTLFLFFSFLFRFQQKPLNAASIKNEKIISCKGCQCAIYKDQTLSLQNLLNPTETLLLWQKCPQHNQSEETNQIMWHWSKLSPIYELRRLVYNVGSQLNLYNSICFVILYSSFLLPYIVLLLISLSRVSLWILYWFCYGFFTYSKKKKRTVNTVQINMTDFVKKTIHLRHIFGNETFDSLTILFIFI